MNLRDLADSASQLAATVWAGQAPGAFTASETTELTNTIRYLTLVWGRTSHALLAAQPVDLRSFMSLTEEMLVGGLISRVALGVRLAGGHSSSLDLQLAQSLLREHSNLLRDWFAGLETREELLPAVLAGQRLRRRLERWSDELLSPGLSHPAVRACLHDSQLAEPAHCDHHEAAAHLQHIGLWLATPNRTVDHPLRAALLRSLREHSWRGISLSWEPSRLVPLGIPTSRYHQDDWLWN